MGTRGGVAVQLQLALKYRLIPRYGEGKTHSDVHGVSNCFSFDKLLVVFNFLIYDNDLKN